MMLRSTFIHIPGVGASSERAFWRRGIATWEDLERIEFAQGRLDLGGTSETRRAALENSKRALANGDLEFFAQRLPKSEHYRIALTIPELTAFVDIETTGLSHYYDEITVVGVGSISGYRFFIKGQADDELKEHLASFKCLVTFNGTLFDLKFLRREFPDLELPSSHIDLRYLTRRLGLSGGQKVIEQQLEIARAPGLEDIRGENAPVLWHEYRMGNKASAELLVQYNRADVEGMKSILDHCVGELVAATDLRPPPFNVPTFSTDWSKLQASFAQPLTITPFHGPTGPKATYATIASDLTESKLRFVGIDLTGSEKRASGWSFLDGNHASTAMLATDQELIEATLGVSPTLVSIDSPLSLPAGRKSVSDDDEGRAEFGIMRECERVLKGRGVNVYPSLIPSMQGLTARGIRLASTFRKLGVPVIESYPGAAQDIMSIPRKRKGLDLLKNGLRDFGIVGDFLEQDVTHDEVDAVTSALVCLFFWAGKFEALGNEQEEYLIIPDLGRSTDLWRSRVVVGLSGQMAAGKTSAATRIEGLGFKYARFSAVLADLLQAQGKAVSRASLQELGLSVHREFGQRWLCKQLASKFGEATRIVIDGLRFPEDHSFLVEAFGGSFMHVHVEAPDCLRRQRYMSVGHSAEEFTIASKHDVESGVSRTGSLAHEIVVNDTDFDTLEYRVVSLLPSDHIQ
jgi:uncharacterized protein YprB with RNaseH-like and TPR domain/predicted nuclease with RNAse H fold/dephospho-CoA kinase